MPADTTVIRLAASSDGQVTAEAFRLSSDDEAQDPPKLSVWDEDQTTPEQAHVFMGSRPRFTLAAFMPVARIRAVTPANSLDVVWDHDTREGAGGHCGITGFDASDAKAAKERRKQLRRQLADVANERVKKIG